MLFLQSNRITKIEGLEKLTHLDQLYLSHNGITKVEGLETLVSRVSEMYNCDFLCIILHVLSEMFLTWKRLAR